MPKPSPAGLLLPLAALMALLMGCGGGPSEELRVAWRPDSALTGADSCIQVYRLQDGCLEGSVWCPPEAAPYMDAQARIRVILSHGEEEAVGALAREAMSESDPDTLQIHHLRPGQALAYYGPHRHPFALAMQQPTAAGARLHQLMQQILDQRRKSAIK